MRVAELPTPALVVDANTLAHNLDTMSTALPGARLRPHVKAHKCTMLARAQAVRGHPGFTCATPSELVGMARAGLDTDLLLANQTVDAARLRTMADSGARVTVAIDSEETIVAAAANGIREVLVDVNVGMPRCGCRPEAAGGLADLARARGLTVRGVMGYEGHVVGLADRGEREEKTATAMEKLLAAHAAVGGDIVSAGGTGTYDINAAATEIQAGSYALMDTAYGSLQLPFSPALRVVATVVHVNPKYAVADCGLKALGMDHGNPTVEQGDVWFCSDEHVTYAPAAPVRVGDRVLVQPAHVDPTVAYHEWFHIAAGPDLDADVTERWPVDLRGWAVGARAEAAGARRRYRAPLMATELSQLDATAQAELVRTGDASPIELVDAAITRVEKLNAELNAVIHPLFDRARAAAAATEGGPFRGVPIVVKDYDGMLAGAPYHAGNRALQAAGHVATDTCYLFEKLERAGFVIVGKTNTPEFGLMPTAEPEAHGPTRNPWDVTRSSGGSSGGSAAAVASGMVPVAHAGDGGGSIRIPASMCGLFGLKPSRGRVSLGPDESEGWGGLVVRHMVTRSVRDSAAILDLLQGYMSGDYSTAPPPARLYSEEVGAEPGRLRIALRTEAPAAIAPTDPACVAAAEDAARLLESLGHTVETGSPAALDEAALIESFSTIMFASLAGVIADTEAQLGRPMTADDVEALTWMYKELAAGISGAAYIQALHAAQQWTRRTVSWWSESGFDLLLTPTLAEPPPEIGDVAARPDDPLRGMARALPFAAYTAPFNITGQPAVSLPTYWTEPALPIGVQLVAAPFREDVLVRVAAQVEAARPWAERRPPVYA